MSTGDSIWKYPREATFSDTEAAAENRWHHDFLNSLERSRGKDIDAGGVIDPRDIEERVQSRFTDLMKRIVKVLIKNVIGHMI